MTLYRRVPQCRICSSGHADEIDRELVGRTRYGLILEKYGPLFSVDKPLTKNVLKNHWRHFKEGVETVALDRVASIQVPPVVAAGSPPQAPGSQQVFEAAVQERVNEIEAIEKLVKSGMDDLDRNEYKPNEDNLALGRRDRLRRNTASIIVESAKIKQMAIQADEDRHRLEKGRVIFRMFQLFGRALETCPNEYRGVIASTLKEVIRDDEEINSLLKEQASRPALPAADEAE